MWEIGWRDRVWSDLSQPWDIIVIGGGITGAGILRQATQKELKVLLVDANDFAFGTSSRSSKMVHGGFRYLRNRQYSVTHEAVREREWMLRAAPNLVTPLPFVIPRYRSSGMHSWETYFGVILYDLMAPKWHHRIFSNKELCEKFPWLNQLGLLGGNEYYDAEMDDARLVLRIIRESVAIGGTALNYAAVTGLMRDRSGKICGVQITDRASSFEKQVECTSRVVINASGPWSDEIRHQIQEPPRLRKLRGSHLVFKFEDFPLHSAVTLMHPVDNRAMFALPWEGTTLIGTTDLDHIFNPSEEPFATEGEIEYIMQAIQAIFPGLHLGRDKIISTFSGLRPVINTGLADPSKESRAHVVWDEQGLVTITGGKLTTFRIMAAEALQKASAYLPSQPEFSMHAPIFDPLICEISPDQVDSKTFAYLAGRYGNEVTQFLCASDPSELENIRYLPNLWAELRWAANQEGIVHLDDLLLRRVRLGLQLPEGGLAELEKVKRIVQPALGWNDQTWQAEVRRYRAIWLSSYSQSPEKMRIQANSVQI
ncbi:MAG TPA: glycerol-3-phosphate dehydrogenase/oxidase [Anaerolineaceae bacterium]|nr:glycerol-3-phosphate dehydrogenase/oxidase [Anaerolineaceae bacterium]